LSGERSREKGGKEKETAKELTGDGKKTGKKGGADACSITASSSEKKSLAGKKKKNYEKQKETRGIARG